MARTTGFAARTGDHSRRGRQDRLRGGDGADTLLARDGALDYVQGDAGRDRGRVNQGLDVVRGVETLF